MKYFAPWHKRPSTRSLGIAATVVFVFLLIGSALIYAIVSGKTRQAETNGATSIALSGVPVPVSSPTAMRALDGRTVPSEERSLRPWAFMIDNQVDARPQEGLHAASVVIEAPVEGGITRLLALYDPATTSTVIGPIRSARPYYIDWAEGYKAVYAHVGGSQEALEKLARTPSSTLYNVDEMARSGGFWRAASRPAPHQVLTSSEQFRSFIGSVATSSVQFRPWRYAADVPPTSSVSQVERIRVPYGGSYSVEWEYDFSQNAYRRSITGRPNSRKPLFVTNVIVLKTDAVALDEVGRLRVRTTGSGDVVIYRDGKKIVGRWRRGAGEVMSFVGTDGVDLELRAGSTWIQVTTDDRVFAGIHVE